MNSMTVHVSDNLNHIEFIGFGEWSDHICCDLLPWLFGDVMGIKWGVQQLSVDFVFLTFDASVYVSADHCAHLRPPIILLN